MTTVVDERPRIEVPELLADIPGAPPGWEWQNQQRELVDRIVNSEKSIVILQAEPGVGKSLVAWAAMALTHQQSLVAVQTRQLERQYLRDFRTLTMMEGRSHFNCMLTNRRADSAPCTSGYACPHRGRFDPAKRRYVDDPDCDYYVAKKRAIDAGTSVHNYAYWLGETKANERSAFAAVHMATCDEAHDLHTTLMSSEVIELRLNYLQEWGFSLPPKSTLSAVRDWAIGLITQRATLRADLELEAARAGIPLNDRFEEVQVEQVSAEKMADISARAARFTRLDGTLATLASLSDEEIVDWILDAVTDSTTFFIKPLYGRYGFKHIRACASRLLLMSAYLAPQLLIRTLDIEPDDVEVIEASKVFDRTKSQILWCPVIKMSNKTSDNEWARVVRVIDALIEVNAPKKGLIHVPSIALRNRIRSLTKYPGLMVTYDGDSYRAPGAMTKDQAIQAFKRRTDQAILLGQSISTGLDIPYHPQWQIIVKMPFPSTGDPAMKERMRRDREFYNFVTICPLVQAVGRIKRAPDHDGPTYILDRNFGWFHAANKAHFPAWFEDNLIYDGWKGFVAVKRALLRKGVIL
jgi:Rad3-related DNA helicase